MGKIIKNGVSYGGSSTSAGNVSYDNTSTGLQSTTVQNAIAELKTLQNGNISFSIVNELPSAASAETNIIYLIDTNNNNMFEMWAIVIKNNTKTWAALGETSIDINDLVGKKEYVNDELRGEIFNLYTGEGKNNATGMGSHAEGYANTASGILSHAEGRDNTVSGYCSHVEGAENTASSSYTHAEGNSTTADGYACHAEGSHTTASDNCAHAEGCQTTASGPYSHAGGLHTIATANSSTAIGKYNVADGTGAHDPKHLFIIGNGTANNARSNILEVSETDMNVNGDIKKNGASLHVALTQAQYDALTPAEKNNGSVYFITDAEGDFSELEDRVGDLETSNQSAVHYKGTTTTAISNGSTTNPITIDGEEYTAVFGDIVVYNYTEFVFDGTKWSEFGRPFDTVPTIGSANAVTSDGVYKNTAGQKYYSDNTLKGEIFNYYTANKASGYYSHAEGYSTVASGYYSHAECSYSAASGNFSHAEGLYTIASGIASHAGGQYTQATQNSMTAIGKYNNPRTDDLFNIGNGVDNNNRSNILEANSTEMNVNGDIKCHNLVVPVGGYEETVLYKSVTNDYVTSITLSDDWRNYDVIVIHTSKKNSNNPSEDYGTQSYVWAPTSQILDNPRSPTNHIGGAAENHLYNVVLSAETPLSAIFTNCNTSGDYANTYLYSIVGIKYPKLYVPPVSLNQAPVALLTQQTEELTDEMR